MLYYFSSTHELDFWTYYLFKPGDSINTFWCCILRLLSKVCDYCIGEINCYFSHFFNMLSNLFTPKSSNVVLVLGLKTQHCPQYRACVNGGTKAQMQHQSVRKTASRYNLNCVQRKTAHTYSSKKCSCDVC